MTEATLSGYERGAMRAFTILVGDAALATAKQETKATVEVGEAAAEEVEEAVVGLKRKAAASSAPSPPGQILNRTPT
eukprot:6193688-Pleurochrysis_carterae.AAC.4